jgi:hypothetical protein
MNLPSISSPTKKPVKAGLFSDEDEAPQEKKVI